MEGAEIVVCEDDADIGRLLAFNLTEAGFAVRLATSVSAAIEACTIRPPHVVVLDLMLGDGDGLDVCRHLRVTPSCAHVGVLMVTALGADEQRIVGFEVGADDYLVKPFVVREVILRVRALAARVAFHPPAQANTVIEIGPITIDHRTHEARVGARVLVLRPLEYRLLALLAAAPGQPFSRADLLHRVWGVAGNLNTRTVDVHVRRLRIALGDAAGWLETVPGAGYRVRAEAL